MGFLIGLLTFVLILDALVVILLVIVQLPKKDAGAGMAFGGGAADALFGAGSGTVLTKITKYAAGIMFGLALLISVMQNQGAKSAISDLEKSMSQAGNGVPTTALPASGTPVAAPPANTSVPLPEAPTGN